MKLWRCSCPGCGHEWQGSRNTCGWCNSPGELLEDTPSFPYRKMVSSLLDRLKPKLHNGEN